MKAESFPRSGVELGGDAIAVVLGEVRHALAFREVLADKGLPIGDLPTLDSHGQVFP